jgi:DNA-binding NtrC family response regulator
MYRLKVFQIQIPPLRARAEDIPLLAAHFLVQLANRYARKELAIGDDAMAALQAHDWPGNVRELRNVLERAVLLKSSGVLREEDVMLVTVPRASAPHLGQATLGTSAVGQSTSAVSLDALEREHLRKALAQCGGNVTQAAKVLGISRDTLRYRMERHGLQR